MQMTINSTLVINVYRLLRLLFTMTLKILDQELKEENCVKLRGVTIDDKLNFHEHIAGLLFVD